MDTLLRKTRMINELLQRENTLSLSSELPYNQMADILGDVLDCNAYIINKEGTVLGYLVHHDFHNERINDMIKNQKFLKVISDVYLLLIKQWITLVLMMR